MSIQLFSIFNRRVPDGKYSILAVGFPTCRHCHELMLLLDAGIEASAYSLNSTTSLSTLEHRVQIYFQAMHLHADWWVTSVKWSSWRSDNMRNILINISVCIHDWCFSLLLTLRVSAWLYDWLVFYAGTNKMEQGQWLWQRHRVSHRDSAKVTCRQVLTHAKTIQRW